MTRWERVRAVIEALGGDTAGVPDAGLLTLLAEVAGRPRHDVSYLVLAVIGGAIPESDDVKRFSREWRAQGLSCLVQGLMRRGRRDIGRVRIETGTVIDVTDTAASRFTTGIQRVAREAVSLWSADHDVTLVTWDPSRTRMVTLDPVERERVVGELGSPAPRETIVPFRGALVLPEISVALPRTQRLRTIARHAGGRSVAIGFDCIPVTTAETAGAGMPGAFSKYLAALARFTTVVPISDAAADEFRGWRRMLAGAGLVGPDIETVTLPFTGTGASDPVRAAELAKQLSLGERPLVLCVGSHEPRKNHLALLHAAELLWQEGLEFDLVMVGGNSWDTHRFDRLVDTLRRRDRRVVTLSGVDDDVIWDLYDLATLSVFASLNEGFGLPVAESLSHGTPVITSGFGSMRGIGEGNGALLADPRDPRSIAEHMRTLLTDEAERERLRELARRRPEESWQHYADTLWRIAHPAPPEPPAPVRKPAP